MSDIKPIERIKAAVRIEEFDHVPVCLVTTGMFYAGLVGEKEIGYYKDPAKMLKWQITFQERFPSIILWLGISPEYGIAVEPSALGCKIQWLEDSSPAVVEPSVKEAEDVDTLEVPDPWSDGIMPMALKAYRYFNEHLPDKFRRDYGYMEGWSMNVIGQIDVAALTRGITDFMADLYRHPDAAHKLLEISTKTLIAYLHAQEEIVGELRRINIADDLSGVISKDFFKEFALPYFLKIKREFPNAKIWFHNDSNTTHVLEGVAEIGIEAFNLGPEVDLASAKARIGDRVCLVGNIHPITVLKGGAPEDTEKACRECIDKAASGGGLMLSGGGAIARNTPLENITMMVKTAETYGKYR